MWADRVVTASNGRLTVALTDNSKMELDQTTSLVKILKHYCVGFGIGEVSPHSATFPVLTAQI
jgi:hypothetical protein